MRKRILIAVTIADSLQFHKGLPELLVMAGWEVFLVSSPGERLESYAGYKSIGVQSLNMARSPRPLTDFVSFFKWLVTMRRINPDVILVGTPKASLLSLAVGYMQRVPTRIYLIHGLRLETMRGFSRLIYKFIEKIACAMSTDVIAVSPSLRTLLIREGIVPRHKVHIVGHGSTNGVNLNVFQSRNLGPTEKEHELAKIGLTLGVPVIGFVGRLTADKGLPELAKALSILKSDGLDVQLLIVGAVDDASGDKALAELKKTGQRIACVGYSSSPENYYPLMDVLCLPSRREGLPGVLLEAMASRVPVVASDATGNKDLIIDDVTGFLFDVGDYTKLADKLCTAIDPGVDKTSITELAYELVTTKFNQNDVNQGFIETIENFLKNRK